MKTKSLTTMLSASLLFMLMPEYVHANKTIQIQLYTHQGCALFEKTKILPLYTHIGGNLTFQHFEDPYDAWGELHKCNREVVKRQKSCELANKPSDHLLPDWRDKCAAQYQVEIATCRSHYEREKSKCDLLKPKTDSARDEKKNVASRKPKHDANRKPKHDASEGSQWEELVPSDKLPPGWEELKPSDAHLYGEEATFVPNRKRDRKTRKDQKGGPADNWKQWEEGNLPGNEMGDMGIDRKGGDMPSLGDSGPKFQDPNPSSYSGAKFRDPNPSGKSGVDLKDLVRLEEREMLEEEKKEYGTLGSPGGVANQGGAIDRSGRTGRISQSCKRAQQRVTRSLTQNQNRSTGSACGNARLYLQVLQYVRGELARSGCPAYAIRAYDKTIAQTRRVAHARCN